jgi:hypothetical protein
VGSATVVKLSHPLAKETGMSVAKYQAQVSPRGLHSRFEGYIGSLNSPTISTRAQMSLSVPNDVVGGHHLFRSQLKATTNEIFQVLESPTGFVARSGVLMEGEGGESGTYRFPMLSTNPHQNSH